MRRKDSTDRADASTAQRRMPRTWWPDATLPLLADPYGFISTQCQRLKTDVFRTRVRFRTILCMSGPEAAALFVDVDRFLRADSAPAFFRKTLIGEGGVQGLDGEAHRHRKAMFLSMVTPERVVALADSTEQEWRQSVTRWASKDRVVLYEELHGLLGRAACAWAGVPLSDFEESQRIGDLAALFDQAGARGLGHLRARRARRRTDRWMSRIIEDIRSGRILPPPHSAAHVIAWHRDLEGKLLDPHIAAVELNNMVRPTMAVSVFITLAATAMHTFPGCRTELARGADSYLEAFVQEVRRFYPFFPFVSARVKRDFDWHGYHFESGTPALLDLHGTNHDPRAWHEPDAFHPERFLSGEVTPFMFIPQGPGDAATNHRCPGESIALALMKVAMRFMVDSLEYTLPEQDLSIESSKLPALPRSRFVMTGVRMRG